MAFNLFQLLESEFTRDVVAKIASFIGEPPANTQTAITNAVPAAIAVLRQKVSTSSGAADLFELLQRGGFDGKAIGTPASVTASPGGLADLVKIGGPLVASLFGSRQTGVTDWLAGIAGIGKTAASSLLGVVAPFLLNLIGRQAGNTSGFTAASIANLIKGHESFPGSTAPRGLAQALGLSQLGEGMSARSYAAATPGPVAPARGEPAMLRWLLPLLLLGALGLLYFWWYAYYRAEPARLTAAPRSLPTPAVVLVKQTACAGEEIEVAKNGVETMLLAFLDDKTSVISGDKRFAFDRLEFETDSAALKPTSRAQLRNIVAILKCYPSVELKIGGHTDNTGDAGYNLKLSQDRADSTKAELVALGVAPARLTAEGYGEQVPVASNDSEEGRQRNRRTDVTVTTK